MTDKKQSILAVLTKPPYGGTTAKEALDAVLTAAAFEVPVSVLFMDDAVFQLLPEQKTEGIEVKCLATTLPVLPMYDVEHIYVDRKALVDRGIDAEQLILSVQPVETDTLRSLFQNHSRILSF
ncbi:sulfurtransferase complex subunit TusC [Motiliproteus sp. MSK22-1]|uniref:sulfurtransferase complex subunit TusC n=1 Tax=Motiliproteus sp. MSK22-1 TaxID=1897630 RepID=UPI0009768F1E|nr:sulfurtransferase complex subunit TusC [Motiliproteus sp. MSK22-1]OMH32684.1 hypothetical protein BGP75_14170 [Motiliproteus sp. MSK22-1]